MDNKVNYALVGLFVITLSIVMVASILWLGMGRERKIYDTYQAYMGESVSGLNQKAAVKYRGVEVGHVRDIALIPDRPNEVRLLLDIQRGTPVTQDTVATLATQGLTGLAYIELMGGKLDAPPPVRQAEQPYPEIKTRPSLLVRIDAAISALLKKFDDISGTADISLKNISRIANTLLSEDNALTIVRTLHNLEKLSATLAARADSIDSGLVHTNQLLEHTVKISKQVPKVLTQLEQSLAAIENTANAFTNTAEAVNTIVENSRQEVTQTTQAITQATAGLNNAVNDSRQHIDRFSRQTLPEVTSSLRDLRDLLSSLRNFSQNLEQKPNILLYGKSQNPPAPGE